MSEPARIGTCRSDIALVREKRGSTWMTVAPRSRAFITQRNATGWASAIEDPWIRIASELIRERGESVAPPRPYVVPRPGTVEECHIRAWFSICTAPIAVNAFLIR